jgi:hypothetical protein
MYEVRIEVFEKPSETKYGLCTLEQGYSSRREIEVASGDAFPSIEFLGELVLFGGNMHFPPSTQHPVNKAKARTNYSECP